MSTPNSPNELIVRAHQAGGKALLYAATFFEVTQSHGKELGSYMRQLHWGLDYVRKTDS